MRSIQKDLDLNSALQAACDTSIASVTGCVYPREGYRYGDYYSDYLEVRYISPFFFLPFLFFFFLSFYFSSFSASSVVLASLCIPPPLFVCSALAWFDHLYCDVYLRLCSLWPQSSSLYIGGGIGTKHGHWLCWMHIRWVETSRLCENTHARWCPNSIRYW